MSTETERNVRFENLARKYSTDLYRYAMWICGNDALAKDLVQETFLRAWKAIDSLQSEKAAKSWLITILRREYARTFEKKVPLFTDIDSVVIPDEDELDPGDRLERKLLRQDRTVGVLLAFEISEQLGVSKSAVMTQLFRAREMLKSKLQEDGVTGNVHELF